jgi:alpha-amylase/alpha-mannosidase (GH57 family)
LLCRTTARSCPTLRPATCDLRPALCALPSFCIHGHFYQPPRADPFTGKVPREPDAAPYANWNERITAECYAPLARRELFRRISFNLGATLARWLDEYAHDIYERIVADERAVYQAHGVGNGLAQSVHHTILPLARRRDKICQIRWGIASFTHRFGHPPEGMWLPEMAVDLETLEVLAAEGVRFTILSDQQVRGDLTDGAGPYRVRLPGGREIAVFVRDRALSDALAFGMPAPENTEQWLREHLEWRCRRGGLVLIATDGETFGHHHPQGIDVLERILDGAEGWGAHRSRWGRTSGNTRPGPKWKWWKTVPGVASTTCTAGPWAVPAPPATAAGRRRCGGRWTT